MRVLIVVGALQLFKPSLVGAVGPFSTGAKFCWQQHKRHSGHSSRNPARTWETFDVSDEAMRRRIFNATPQLGD
jgi:hypothetical protein